MKKYYQRFKIRPFLEPEYPKYYWVTIFHTKEDLHKRLKKIGDTGPKCKAICMNFEKLRILSDGTEELTNHVGDILFYKDFVGTGVVSHELAHAALYYYRKFLKLNFNTWENDGDADESEEEFCFLLQCLVDSFWAKADYEHPKI